MTPTVWVQDTAVVTGWVDGIPTATDVEGYSMFDDFVFPIEGGSAYGDITASYTEDTAPAASYTEDTAPVTTYVEDIA